MLKNIRELFWPLLEKEEPKSNENDIKPKLYINQVNLEEAYRLNTKFTENEEDRRKSIESKAALFLGSISIVTSLLIAANALLIGNEINHVLVKFSISITFILTIYALRTVWYAIKALNVGAYQVLDFSDINISGDKNEFYLHLIKRQESIIKNNHSIINSKVDNFNMAQAYYKRAIIALSIYSFLILLLCFFYKKPPKSSQAFTVEIVDPVSRHKINYLKDSLSLDTFSVILNKHQDTFKINSSKIPVEQK